MRKLLFWSALTMMAAVSCNKELENETPAAPAAETVTFIATVDGTGTKTVLGSDYTPMWSGEESITIHDGTTGHLFKATADVAGEATVEFKAEATLAGDKVIAVYPAGTYTADPSAKTVTGVTIPADQALTVDSYDPSAAISVAYSEDNTLKFNNAVSLIKFTVGNENVSEVCFFGNSGEKISGAVSVDITTGVPVVTPQESATTYAKVKGAIEKDNTYYIAIAPDVNFAGGFTLEYVIDGTKYQKSTDKKFTIGRNLILDLGVITFDTSVVETKIVYFKPNAEWVANNAKFGAHFWSPDNDVIMTDADGDGIYVTEVPKTLDNVIFVCLSSDATKFSWDKKIYQTSNLTTDNECFALDYSGSAGKWMTLAEAKVYSPEPPAAIVPETGCIYLNAATWNPSSARFAAYFFNGPSDAVWLDMEAIEGNSNIFKVSVPTDYKTVIFARMNPATSENNFNQGVKWNQTGDLTIPTDGKVLFTISAWDNQTEGWSTLN